MATITYNVTTVGSPTFNNGIVSNFSNSDYCYITDNVTLGSNWEFGTKCNFGSGIPDCCAISGLGNQYIALGTDPNVNGINWNIGNGSSWLNPTFVDRSIVSNTDYWFKITFNGVQYALYKSTDGINYGSVIAYLDTTTEIPEFQFLIGTGRGLSEVAFPQWIDLRETYIKKNGVEVWRGATVSSGAGVRIQLRHDTASNFSTVNPVLAEGEAGFETNTNKMKIGDGITNYNSLEYFGGDTDEFYFKAGDTFNFNSNYYPNGATTNNKLGLVVPITLPKSIAKISTITATGNNSFYAYQNGNRYIIDPTSNDIALTVAKTSDNVITLTITSASAEIATVGRANCYVGISSSDITFSFS